MAVASEFELGFEREMEQAMSHPLGEMHESHEHEQEHEQFFNHLAAMADRGGRSQALRRIALAAARQALRAAGAQEYESELASEFESENEYEYESEAHEQSLNAEVESELEFEYELNPVRRVYADAQLEHMGHSAAEAETEQEAAEQFLPLLALAAKPLIGLAAKGAVKLAPKLFGKVVPNLTRGIGRMARMLFRNRRTRPLLRTIPRIARNTMRDITRQAVQGQRVTPKTAARTLARQTVRVMGSPHRCAAAYRQSRVLDQRFHHAAGRALGMPLAASPAMSAPTTANKMRRCPTCGQCRCS